MPATNRVDTALNILKDDIKKNYYVFNKLVNKCNKILIEQIDCLIDWLIDRLIYKSINKLINRQLINRLMDILIKRLSR